ncbi:MAG TPA: glycosyltransferase [Terriglobales bacterium]|nr:glycosyltransferase [Terriglobales bacterium]
MPRAVPASGAEIREAASNQPEISVVMPCLNESSTLASCIRQIQITFAAHGIEGEIIVADNGSTDGSQGIAEWMGARVVPVASRGYGSALMGGIAAARGTYVAMGDSDASYDFGDLPKFLTELRGGADLVIGNRFRGGIRRNAMPALHKYLGNPVLTGIGRLLFDSPCGDFHCGLRAFRKDAYQRMDLQTTGMEFASEMVVKATLFGMRIAEVATTLSPDGRDRAPHLRSWSDGWRHLRFLLMYSPRWLFLYPGGLLMLIGALTALWLLPGPRHVGGVTFDIHTLLYAVLAVLVGFQAVLFAVFTKVFAITEGLLPDDPRFANLFRYVKLETGLVTGAVLMVAGFATGIYSLLRWDAMGFGSLDPVKIVRLVAITMLSVTLGVQISLSSFFLSILGLRRR